MAAQKVFMKSDKESLLSVSRVAMRLPEAHRIARRADLEPAGAPLVVAEDDLPPEVVGVPQGAFQWT